MASRPRRENEEYVDYRHAIREEGTLEKNQAKARRWIGKLFWNSREYGMFQKRDFEK